MGLDRSPFASLLLPTILDAHGSIARGRGVSLAQDTGHRVAVVPRFIDPRTTACRVEAREQRNDNGTRHLYRVSEHGSVGACSGAVTVQVGDTDGTFDRPTTF